MCNDTVKVGIESQIVEKRKAASLDIIKTNERKNSIHNDTMKVGI